LSGLLLQYIAVGLLLLPPPALDRKSIEDKIQLKSTMVQIKS
jgi:hypothetical protein